MSDRPRTLQALTRARILTLHITAGGTLVGETPKDDELVRQLCPPRPGDQVDGRGPGPIRSNLEVLISRAAASRVRLIIRTDLPPIPVLG